MNIRLIQPSQLDERGNPTRFKKLFMPFLTMPTLAGLTPAGVDVAITEDCVEDIDYDEDVDLVGITAQTCQAPRAYQIADEFRKRGKKTIMGGIHASMCPEEASRHVDSVMVGEAEDVWAGIVADARANQLRRMYKAADRPTLEASVVPRFDLLDFRNYVTPPFARTPLLPIQTSRGCPFDCEFCSVAVFLGHTVRCKPIVNVVREIETARPSRVFFTDDNMVGHPPHARALFEALKPLRLRWACQMSTTILRVPDLIERAAASGCHEAFIGIESLNDQALKSARKGFNAPREYAELFRRLKDVGILPQVSLVYGLDGDTVDHLEQTIEEILSWDVNYLYIFVLTPFPGTPLYERVQQSGRLMSSNWSLYDAMHAVVKFDPLDAGELLALMRQAYERFYSGANIARRVGRFWKQYVRYFPRDMVIEEVFFQHQMGTAVRQGLHPFSLGLRINST